jgi:TonB family protein
MVKYFIIVVCLFCVNLIWAQSNNKYDNDTLERIVGLTHPDRFPEFDIHKFLFENLKYPKTAIEGKIEGTVFIEFIIQKDGTTTDHTIMKGVNEEFDKEALRATKLIKFDTPATLRGRPVAVKYSVPVKFNIKQQSSFAQNRCDDTTDLLFITYEDLPIFDKKSPDYGMSNFLKENIKYPETAIEDKIEGTVFIEFWIDTAGLTHEHRVIKGAREDLDNEALRVAKLIKFDIPAKSRGKPIAVCYAIPIKFSLSEKAKSSRRFRKW